MALVVEDGSGVANANAFVTLADAETYFADYQNMTWSAASDADKTAAILRASAWLSSFPVWEGDPANARGGQGLAWPRTGVTDCNGDTVESDEVPAEVKTATYIAAAAELASPGVLTPTITPGKQKKRVKADVVEVEYMTATDQGGVKGDSVTSQRPVLTQIEDLLRCMASFRRSGTPWPFVA